MMPSKSSLRDIVVNKSKLLYIVYGMRYVICTVSILYYKTIIKFALRGCS